MSHFDKKTLRPTCTQAEGFVLGVGAKIFTISGPVIACVIFLCYHLIVKICLAMCGEKNMIQEIIRIQYAASTLPESCIFDGGEKEKRIPIIFSIFLICTENKKVLVDAGCETMPGFEMKNFKTPMAVLKEKGIDVTEITDVIITHAHHDHIECVKYFKNAVVHIQEQEYARGEKYLSENPFVCTFSDEATVDDCLKIVKIGGHCRGSSIVECKMDNKIYVLCGDECYSLYNIQNRIPTGSSYSPENSRKFIEKYTQAPYECLLCHDIG